MADKMMPSLTLRGDLPHSVHQLPYQTHLEILSLSLLEVMLSQFSRYSLIQSTPKINHQSELDSFAAQKYH
jgi:hypothetical protein